MIEVENLTKNYGTTRAVDGISFSVRPGEVVGLLGPNGAGKSTTLKILTGYLPAGGGTVRMDGLDVGEQPLEARRRIGYLSENNPLYESLGVWECLELVAQLRGLPASLIPRRTAEVAKQCALLDVAGKDVGQLSKGYRQRLGFALAILHDPHILILDEPTSALDPIQRREVRDLVLSLKEKKTVLLSTHILPEAQSLCDRLLIVNRGKIVAEGTVAELQGRLEGAESFYVRVKGPRGAVEAKLKSIAKAVEYADEAEPGAPAFVVSSDHDPRPAITAACASENWALMELRRKGASLEDIFHSLTGGAS